MALTFEVAGSVLSFNASDFRARLAEACIVPVAHIALTIAPGSVIITATIRVPDINASSRIEALANVGADALSVALGVNVLSGPDLLAPPPPSAAAGPPGQPPQLLPPGVPSPGAPFSQLAALPDMNSGATSASALGVSGSSTDQYNLIAIILASVAILFCVSGALAIVMYRCRLSKQPSVPVVKQEFGTYTTPPRAPKSPKKTKRTDPLDGEIEMEDAQAIRAASEEACRDVMRRHLQDYLRANGPNASYQAWIATLHPENVTMDARLWLEDSEQLKIWTGLGKPAPKTPKGAALPKHRDDAENGDGMAGITRAPVEAAQQSARAISMPPPGYPPIMSDTKSPVELTRDIEFGAGHSADAEAAEFALGDAEEAARLNMDADRLRVIEAAAELAAVEGKAAAIKASEDAAAAAEEQRKQRSAAAAEQRKQRSAAAAELRRQRDERAVAARQAELEASRRAEVAAAQELRSAESAAFEMPYTDEEAKQYQKIFREVSNGKNLASRQEIEPTMARAKLTPAELDQLWTLCDVDDDGFFDEEEFTLALHLAAWRFDGEPLPEHIPPEWLSREKRRQRSNSTAQAHLSRIRNEEYVTRI